MRVTADDRVHPFRNAAGEIDNLAGAARLTGRAPLAERAAVRNDDDGLRASRAEQPRPLVDDGCERQEPQIRDVDRHRGSRRLDRRQSNDADPDRPDGHQRIVAYPIDVAGISEPDVRAEYGVARLAHAGTQRVTAPVPLVVA